VVTARPFQGNTNPNFRASKRKGYIEVEKTQKSRTAKKILSKTKHHADARNDLEAQTYANVLSNPIEISASKNKASIAYLLN